MTSRHPRGHDQRGIALSSPVALLSAAAVVLAGVAFVSTNHADEPVVTAQQVTATPTADPAATVAPKPVITKKKQAVRKKKKHQHKAPGIRRADTYVEVYNNSGISGLAGSTAGRIAGAGWQVVGSDNWYGTIPATTVYYPARLQDEAKLLARDLGISRLKPSIAPMRFDRLTVILTSDFT